MSGDSGYNHAHHVARKRKAAKCERCPATERLEMALRPDTPPERLLTCTETGCAYSNDPSDYMTLCKPCHAHMDMVESRPKCPRGHEFTPENTSIRSATDSRRCLACHRENEAKRRADPDVRARKNAQDRLYKQLHPMTDEQKARKIELQRQRRRKAASGHPSDS